MVTVDNNDTVLYGCIGTATIRAKNATLKKELDKLEFVYPKSHSNLFQYSLSFDSNSLIFGTIEPANATVFSWEKYIAHEK
ncbi:MAG: hypothetical protein IJ499_00270, partial [Clostridia bacterium]|nr:hypothetical protein [Clostridia bacterium]